MKSTWVFVKGGKAAVLTYLWYPIVVNKGPILTTGSAVIMKSFNVQFHAEDQVETMTIQKN